MNEENRDLGNGKIWNRDFAFQKLHSYGLVIMAVKNWKFGRFWKSKFRKF